MRYSTFLRYYKGRTVKEEIDKFMRITQNQVSKYDTNCDKNGYRIYDKIYTSYNPVPLLYKDISKYPYHYTNIKKNN
tara:strand:+ start:3797 stop:4027 length:231 start_codon:yes stop_codon:yes gene_type:complete